MSYELYIWEIITYTLITILSSLNYVYFKYQEKNKFKRLFVPKNDSIWERLKVLLSSFIVVKLLEIILVGFNSNVLFATFISIIIMSVVNLIAFTIIYMVTKYDMIIQNIITNITSILSGLLVSIIVVGANNLPTSISYISIFGLLIFLFFYVVATYFQTDDIIFIDPNSKKNKLKKDSWYGK